MNDDQIKEAYERLTGSATALPAATLSLDRTASRRANRRRALGTGGAAVACAAIVLAGLGVANWYDGTGGQPVAEPSVTEDASPGPVAVWQQQIAPYKRELITAAGSSDAYVGARYDNPNHAIILYGTTESAPERIQEVIARAPANVDVEWRTVPYSKPELDQARNQLMEAMPEVITASFTTGYRGIVLGVEAETLRAERSSLESRAAEVTDIPVTFSETSYPRSGPYVEPTD